MTVVARMLTLEADGIPGYAAYSEGAGPRPGIMMVHHAHGVTADYKVDAYRLAALGFNAGCERRRPITAVAAVIAGRA